MCACASGDAGADTFERARTRRMGHKQTRMQHAKVAQVALQVHHGSGAVHETVAIEYFDAAELIRSTWNACVQAAHAHDLLL